METSQMICSVDQFTGFYVSLTLAWYRLKFSSILHRTGKHLNK